MITLTMARSRTWRIWRFPRNSNTFTTQEPYYHHGLAQRNTFCLFLGGVIVSKFKSKGSLSSLKPFMVYNPMFWRIISPLTVPCANDELQIATFCPCLHVVYMASTRAHAFLKIMYAPLWNTVMTSMNMQGYPLSLPYTKFWRIGSSTLSLYSEAVYCKITVAGWKQRKELWSPCFACWPSWAPSWPL